MNALPHLECTIRNAVGETRLFLLLFIINESSLYQFANLIGQKGVVLARIVVIPAQIQMVYINALIVNTWLFP